MYDVFLQIYTTKLLVKGLYNSLTLAAYGYVVDDVPIKPSPVQIKVEPVASNDSAHEDEKGFEETNLEIKEESGIKIKSLDTLRGK